MKNEITRLTLVLILTASVAIFHPATAAAYISWEDSCCIAFGGVPIDNGCILNAKGLTDRQKDTRSCAIMTCVQGEELGCYPAL